MSITSELVKIKNNGSPSTEYIEKELKSKGIDALRWAIVDITNDFYTINVAYETNN